MKTLIKKEIQLLLQAWLLAMLAAIIPGVPAIVGRLAASV